MKNKMYMQDFLSSPLADLPVSVDLEAIRRGEGVKKGFVVASARRRAIMSNIGFKQVRNVSSAEPTGKVAVLSDGSFVSDLSVLCNPAIYHAKPMMGRRRISSAAVLDISTFDEFAKKTRGVDIAFLSSFINLKTEEQEKNNTDISSVDESAWFDIVSEGSKMLRAKLEASRFGYAEVDGEYRSKESQGSEISFLVSNANSGVSTEKFFDYIVDLGKAHGQESVLLKPAIDLQFRGKPLACEIAYWHYCQSGKVSRQGLLRKRTIEEWIVLGNKGGIGGSRFDGQSDRITFACSSFIITGIDFSRLSFGKPIWGSVSREGCSVTCLTNMGGDLRIASFAESVLGG